MTPDKKKSTTNQTVSSPSTGPLILLAVALFFAGILLGHSWRQPLMSTTAAEEPTAVSLFAEAWGLLHDHYVDPAALDDRKLLAGALRGLANAVGDNGHTRYLTAEELAQHSEQLSGSYTGVGIEIEETEAGIVVRSVFDGSPAQRAGIRSGDILIAVDGVPTEELDLGAVVERVRGPEGTAVTLTFRRAGAALPLEVTLIRAKIRLVPVRWALLPDGIGLLRLSSFATGASEATQAAVQELERANVRAMILDLRGNPGGLVDESVRVAGLFLPPDTVVFRSRDREGNETVYRTPGDRKPTAVPLVVLIDEGSASASEIVAGALQDYQRAVLIGEKTFGTGTVLIEYRLRDGSALLIGTQVWVTPNGRVIWRDGITPDIVVGLSPTATVLVPNNGEVVSEEQVLGDDQVAAAWRLLTGYPAGVRMGGSAGCLRCQ